MKLAEERVALIPSIGAGCLSRLDRGPPASRIRRRSPTAPRRVPGSLPLAVSNHCLIKTIRRRCHASSCRDRCYQLSAVIRERARPSRDVHSRGGCGRECSPAPRRVELTTPVVGPDSRPRNASTLRPLRGAALRCVAPSVRLIFAAISSNRARRRFQLPSFDFRLRIDAGFGC